MAASNWVKQYTLDIYTVFVYIFIMIKSFADAETEKVYHQTFSKKLPQAIQRIALRKLMEAVEKELLHKPDKKTLDRLSLLAGFQSWEDFQNALHGE